MDEYNILVVDDDPDITEVITLYLRNSGYNVNTASNCNEALKKINNEYFHLIILDIMLPDFDGTFFVKKLDNIYIVLLSLSVVLMMKII
jgi:DNA-binding response OmpR family regulator